MSARELAVICRIHHDRSICQTKVIEFVQDARDLGINCSNAVDVKVIETAPAFLLGRDPAEHVSPDLVEFPVRLRPPGRSEWLSKVLCDRRLPISFINFAVRCG